MYINNHRGPICAMLAVRVLFKCACLLVNAGYSLVNAPMSTAHAPGDHFARRGPALKVLLDLEAKLPNRHFAHQFID